MKKITYTRPLDESEGDERTPSSARVTITEPMVEAAAQRMVALVMAKIIEKPQLVQWQPWAGSARAILEAALECAPSATRLTGETPRTEAAIKVAHSAGFPLCEPEVVHASFARQIESELNAARHAIQWFVVADWPKGYDAWPAELKKAIVAATDSRGEDASKS